MNVLQDVLATAPLFSDFVESDLVALASAMRSRQLAKGQVLFREGQQGDAMVLVVAGELDILSEGDDGQVVELARIGVGHIVGEMSALDPAPRSATVRAAGDATVHVLDRTMLGAVMSNAPSVYASLLHGIGRVVMERIDQTNQSIRSEAFGQFAAPEPPTRMLDEAAGDLVTVPIDPSALAPLEGFNERERRALLGSAPIVAYKDGDVLCAEGRPGHTCFIIGEGSVEVIRHAGDQEHRLAVLGAGAVVGQLALLHDTARSATVRAKGPVWALAIGRGSFGRLLAAHTSVGLKIHEQVVVAGIRQLRLASRMLTELRMAEEDTDSALGAPAAAPAPAAPKAASDSTAAAPRRRKPAARGGKTQRGPAPLAAERARRARQAWRAVDGGVREAAAERRGKRKRAPSQEMAVYVTTALEEWGLSLADLDKVEISVPEGHITARELKLRKG